jgi:hypothetical protein
MRQTRQIRLALELRRAITPLVLDEPELRVKLIALMAEAIVDVFNAHDARRAAGETDEQPNGT